MQLLRKTQPQFTRLDQQQIFFFFFAKWKYYNKYFSDKFLILKFLFSELELKQFNLSSSLSLDKLFFRVQVRVRQNNRVFSSSSLQPWYWYQFLNRSLWFDPTKNQTEVWKSLISDFNGRRDH